MAMTLAHGSFQTASHSRFRAKSRACLGAFESGSGNGCDFIEFIPEITSIAVNTIVVVSYMLSYVHGTVFLSGLSVSVAYFVLGKRARYT